MYGDFESILVPEHNEKQNPDESYACSYGYKLVNDDNKFRKHYRSYLGKDPVYIFINSMTEKNKYCCDVMKKKI